MKPRLRGTIALLVIALVVRMVTVVQWSSDAGFSWHSNLLVDTDSYLRLAYNWSQSGDYGFEDATGHVTPSAFRPPLYPWLLSWLPSGGTISIAWIAMLNILLGVVTVWLSWSIGRQLGLRWAWLGGLAVAVDPILLRASQSAMTETLAAALALAVWRTWLFYTETSSEAGCLISTRRSSFSLPLISVGMGTLLGLCILARPTAAPWAILCVASMLWIGSSCWKQRLFHALLASVCVMACVLPWTLRNWTHIGKPIWATSHGGYTLLLANNPLLYEHFRKNGPSRNWDAEAFHAIWTTRGDERPDVESPEFWQQGVNELSSSVPEIEDDELAYRAARATIARQPTMFFLSCIYRIGWLWAWWPNQSSFAARFAIGTWYAVWFSAAAWGFRRILASRNTREWMPAFLLIIALTGIHAIYWSNMRMRAPAMPVVVLLAAALFNRKQTSNERDSTGY